MSETRLKHHLRNLGLEVLSGALASALILGIGGRLIMRVIAVAARLEQEFTLFGSLEVIAFAFFIGVPAGLGVALLKNFLPAGNVLRGTSIGLLTFLVVLGLLPPHIKANATGLPDHLGLIWILFVAVFILFGITQCLIHLRLTRRFMPQPHLEVQ